MGIFSSKTKVGPPADVITTPQTGYSFVSPYMEDYSRRLLASYFGSPGEYAGLISQPRDIPIEQTAGLTPLQIQARQATAGLGDFQESLDKARGLFGKEEATVDQAMGFIPEARRMIGTGAETVAGGIGALRRGEETALGSARMFDPASASRFMDPYEDQVVQQTLEDINRQAAMEDIGLRDRAISQGAFGGSRGRISQEELARQVGRGAAEAVSGIRSRGFGQSLGSAQSAFESQQARQAGLGAMQAELGGQQAAIGAQQAALGGQLAGLGAAQAGLGQQYGQIGQGIAGLGQQGQSQLGTQTRSGYATSSTIKTVRWSTTTSKRTITKITYRPTVTSWITDGWHIWRNWYKCLSTFYSSSAKHRLSDFRSHRFYFLIRC